MWLQKSLSSIKKLTFIASVTIISLIFYVYFGIHLKLVPVPRERIEFKEANLEAYPGSALQIKKVIPRSEPRLILIYTTLFGNSIWHGLEGTKLRTHLEKYNCVITYDKNTVRNADGVLFHARDVEIGRHGTYSAKNLSSVKQQAPHKQKWIFLSHENPQRDPSIYSPYNGIFNWTATFSQKSDVFIPYSSYIKLERSIEVSKNYAKGKTGLVAWAVSNCNLIRQQYALQLEKFINITVFGGCRNYFKNRGDCPHGDSSCDNKLASFKFILAFENDFCEDYVTEKYWLRIMQNTVPVVMGATYDKRLVIPGSYIDASSFTSIKALADYLLYLNKNDTAYNEYFKWKSTYTLSPNENLHIRICQALHSNKFAIKSKVMLSEEFNYERMCQAFQWKIDELTKKIYESKTKDFW